MFHTGSAHGIHPSELSPPERHPGGLPPGRTHLPFCPPVFPSPKRWAGPDRPRFLGICPFESPWRPGGGLIRQPLDAPLGLSLSGLVIGDLGRAFARTPLTRFTGLKIARLPAGVPEYRSASDPPLLLTMPKHPAWRGSPHRLLAPARSRTFRRKTRRDMSSPRIASCITADHPMLLSEPFRPTAVAGIGLRCRAFATSSRRPSGLRKTIGLCNSLAHRTTWLRSDLPGYEFTSHRVVHYCRPPDALE